ncbi:hypothetical protein [Nonomuraea aurantiaca]|uniref:hypothetical protein n=1 Tax=Nonomuraea aurantiaca TaxID=2878562 RepID=UPI001CD9EDC0|nr:hypothetical protein [Nonomuraea aurantiaca]MCA2220189.1 hypothetical protein [Nonomuraea aurantiaca]
MTEAAPPPGAVALTGLRARARAARRTAIATLSGSLALITFSQSLAERVPARADTLPLAVLALMLFLAALPALALTQTVWGARVRAVRRRERELYASPPRTPPRALSRLSVGCGWAVTLLLGCTVPRPFRESGLYGFADAMSRVTEALALAGSAAGVCFLVWWARGAGGKPARAGRPGGSPGDPWDPDRLTRRRRGPALHTGAAVAVAALVGARAHLWEPSTLTLSALLAAVLVCGVVTDE